MIKITDVIIDSKTLGRKLMLVDVKPAFAYSNGERTNEISGYKYTVVCPEKGFEKQTVKIDGKQRCEEPSEALECAFDGLDLFVYWTPSGYQLGARAENIRIKGQTA